MVRDFCASLGRRALEARRGTPRRRRRVDGYSDRRGVTMRKRMLTTAGAVIAAVLAVLAIGAVPAAAKDKQRVMIYTGTTGYRHADAINNGRPVVQAALEQAGYTVDWEDCTDNGGNVGNCDHPTENPRVFTKHNLKRYDALLFFNA